MSVIGYEDAAWRYSGWTRVQHVTGKNSMDSLPASIWFGGIRDQMIHEDDV